MVAAHPSSAVDELSAAALAIGREELRVGPVLSNVGPSDRETAIGRHGDIWLILPVRVRSVDLEQRAGGRAVGRVAERPNTSPGAMPHASALPDHHEVPGRGNRDARLSLRARGVRIHVELRAQPCAGRPDALAEDLAARRILQALPHHDELAVGRRGHIRHRLRVRGVGVDVDLAGEGSARRVVEASKDAGRALAAVDRARPHDHERAVGLARHRGADRAR